MLKVWNHMREVLGLKVFIYLYIAIESFKNRHRQDFHKYIHMILNIVLKLVSRIVLKKNVLSPFHQLFFRVSACKNKETNCSVLFSFTYSEGLSFL